MSSYSSRDDLLLDQFFRMKWAKSVYPLLFSLHKSEPLIWKADIFLNSSLEEGEKLLAKFKRHYPKDKFPALLVLEQSLLGTFHCHMVGRGALTKEVLRELWVDALCKDKRRIEERKQVSSGLRITCEPILNTEEKNPEACINYLLKSTSRLSRKVEPLAKHKKNYRDLGLIPVGGFHQMRKRARLNYRVAFAPLEFDPDLPDNCE